MATEQVARLEWRQRLAAFAASHEGWLVSIDALDPTVGTEHVVEELPLIDLSMDVLVADVRIVVGSSTGDRRTITIRAPTAVYVDETEERAESAIAIASADGRLAVLRLARPMRPELVDGLVRP
jgi:hypothetical protein